MSEENKIQLKNSRFPQSYIGVEKEPETAINTPTKNIYEQAVENPAEVVAPTENLMRVLEKLPIKGVKPRQKSELERKCELEHVTINFLTYPDGTLRLFKRGQIIGEVPAGYSEENAVIKVRVTRPSEDFVVILPVTRTMLDQPDAMEELAYLAYNWKNE